MKTPKKQEGRLPLGLMLLDIGIGLILGGSLIILRVCEVNNIFYRIVFALCAIWCILNWFYVLAGAAGSVRSAYRRFKRDRRIIRQAKAAGVWGKPQLLGGRALELYAKKKHGIKRKPGQTDRSLRMFCIIKEHRALDYSIEKYARKYTGEKYKDGIPINIGAADESEPRGLEALEKLKNAKSMEEADEAYAEISLHDLEEIPAGAKIEAFFKALGQNPSNEQIRAFYENWKNVPGKIEVFKEEQSKDE